MFRKYSEILFVVLLGLLIFGGLNLAMVYTSPEDWTSTRLGAWTAFHRGFDFSGFDQFTYISVTQFRPIYVHLRHPALLYMVWPMMKVNEWLKHEYGINCAIYVVGVVWTIVSTLSWVTLYKILRRIIGLTILESLLLNTFFYSFAYVMLATFVPDHMVLSLATILLTLYLSGKALQQGKVLATWKILVLYFIATGISTTNAIKIWLIDMAARRKNGAWLSLFKHSLLYLIPTVLLVGIYYYQENTAQVEEERFQQRIVAKAIKKDSIDHQNREERAKKILSKRENKQIVNIPLFEWTDMTIPVIPTLVHNIYGEGFQLHKDYLLKDANVEGHRPIFVEYNDWYNYVAEAVIVLLLLVGIAAGRNERFMWMCMMPFLLDMFLHIVLRFALTDVYIMTSHWAFIIPIAIAYLIKKMKAKPMLHTVLLSSVSLLTVFLWWHNLSLVIYHFLSR